MLVVASRKGVVPARREPVAREEGAADQFR
jgi:hypothetical protein